MKKTPMNFNINNLAQTSTMIKKRPAALASIRKFPTTDTTTRRFPHSLASVPSKNKRRDTFGLNNANSVDNTFNVSNWSTSTEMEQIGNINNVTAADPSIAMSMMKIPSFSPYERKMKMLEDQLKRYEQVLLSVTNFDQFQRSMMMSTTSNFQDLNSTFNVHQDDEQTPQSIISIRRTNHVTKTATVRPIMDFSRMETTNFSHTKENREIPKENQMLNRGIFTHINISQELSGEDTTIRARTPLASIQTRQSIRTLKKVKQVGIEKAATIQKQKMMDIQEVLSSQVPKTQLLHKILAIFNEGSPKDLEKIPLVGKKISTQIIIQRNKKPFRKLEDLRRICYFASEKNWKKFLT